MSKTRKETKNQTAPGAKASAEALNARFSITDEETMLRDLEGGEDVKGGREHVLLARQTQVP